MDPFDTLVTLYTVWLKATFSAVWRPTVVFAADTTKGYAAEQVAHTLADISFTYLSGRGWSVATAAKVAPKVISKSFVILDLIWPSDIGREPTPPEMEKLLKSMEEQRKKESLPETKKRPAKDLPDTFRAPASAAPPINVSTEEQRRRVIFEEQTLTQAQAYDKLVKGATILHGAQGGRFLDNLLWLFDIERIEHEGLSEEAEQIFNEMYELALKLQQQRGTSRFHNACLVAPPNWYGSPTRYTCSLPDTQEYDSCLCPPPPNMIAGYVRGFPTRLSLGQVCVVEDIGVCPMIKSAPLGGFCTCPEHLMLPGQIRQ